LQFAGAVAIERIHGRLRHGLRFDIRAPPQFMTQLFRVSTLQPSRYESQPAFDTTIALLLRQPFIENWSRRVCD
jgi:hypothetical protein